MTGLLDFIDDDRSAKLLSDDGITILNYDEFLLMKHLDDCFTVLVCFIVSVRHTVCHKVSDQRYQLSSVLRAVLIHQQ